MPDPIAPRIQAANAEYDTPGTYAVATDAHGVIVWCMTTVHETYDQIVDRVTREQFELHQGVSDGVEHLGRKEATAVGIAAVAGVIVALAVGLPSHWSPVMAIFVGFAAALAVFLVSSIVLVEREDGRVDDEVHREADAH